MSPLARLSLLSLLLLPACAATDELGGAVAALEQAPPAGAIVISREEARALLERGLLEPIAKAAATVDREAPRAVTLRDHAGVERALVLEAPSEEPKLDARANAIARYARLHQMVRGTRFERELALPDPREAERLDLASVIRLVRSIVARADEIQDAIYPRYGVLDVEGKPLAEVTVTQGKLCAGGTPADLGDGDGGNLQTVSSLVKCEPSDEGIIKNDPRSYREHLGCVRDQGHRGTCVAFAVASAMETSYSKSAGVKLNLSEQKLYYRAKLGGSQEDGLSTRGTMAAIADGDWLVPFEDSWNYNPSHARNWIGDNGGPFSWEHSCDKYDETCSDFVGQGQMVCAEDLGGFECWWFVPSPSDGAKLTGLGGLELWDYGDLETSLLAVKAALFSGSEVVLSIEVTGTILDAMHGDGFARYDGFWEPSHGRHAMHVVSYIDKDDLFAILPDAPYPDGGGYLVVRNSYGPCTGDGGYLYIPYFWLTRNGLVTSAVQLLADTVELQN